MPQETKSKTPLESDTSLQHYSADRSDMLALCKAIELAVDYRGDVTIERTNDPAPIECFLFDFQTNDDPSKAKVRFIVKGEDARTSIALEDVQRIVFTGKDTAAGKSFDTWMQKYVAKKLAGETASIESESLDDA
jgi:hypothetical protein